MNLKVELEQETNGRWIAEIPELPGVWRHSRRRSSKARVLTLQVYAEALQLQYTKKFCNPVASDHCTSTAVTLECGVPRFNQ
jgi:hypothetical protein